MAVRWNLRYGLSYRDVEELLAERGITVDHVTVYRWVQRFTPEFIQAARPCRYAPGDRWFVDEINLKVVDGLLAVGGRFHRSSLQLDRDSDRDQRCAGLLRLAAGHRLLFHPQAVRAAVRGGGR